MLAVMQTTFTLGGRIREARGSLTQDELADRVRVKRPKVKLTGVRVSRYERNVQSPRLSVLIAIAEATDKPLDFFRTDDNGEQPSGDADDEEAELLTRAAYHLEKGGEYAMADALLKRARHARFASSRENVLS